MARRSETLSRRAVFDGYFRPDEVTFRHSKFDGEMSEPVDRLVLDIGEVAAGLVLKRTERKVVLVEQFRYPATLHDDGWLIELVAGRVDEGETPEQAFRRETLEEAGYVLEDIRPVHRYYSSAGVLVEHVNLFVADAARRAGAGGGTDHDEDIRVIEWTYDEFFAAIDTGRIVDAKTLIAGQWLKLQRV